MKKQLTHSFAIRNTFDLFRILMTRPTHILLSGDLNQISNVIKWENLSKRLVATILLESLYDIQIRLFVV